MSGTHAMREPFFGMLCFVLGFSIEPVLNDNDQLSFRVLRASRISRDRMRRSSLAASVAIPCRHAPLAFPFGAPARAPSIRHTLRPLTAGAMQRQPDRLLVAEQRGAILACVRRCMGLALLSMRLPSPLVDPDNGLPSAHVDVLHANALLAG